MTATTTSTPVADAAAQAVPAPPPVFGTDALARADRLLDAHAIPDSCAPPIPISQGVTTSNPLHCLVVRVCALRDANRRLAAGYFKAPPGSSAATLLDDDVRILGVICDRFDTQSRKDDPPCESAPTPS